MSSSACLIDSDPGSLASSVILRLFLASHQPSSKRFNVGDSRSASRFPITPQVFHYYFLPSGGSLLQFQEDPKVIINYSWSSEVWILERFPSPTIRLSFRSRQFAAMWPRFLHSKQASGKPDTVPSEFIMVSPYGTQFGGTSGSSTQIGTERILNSFGLKLGSQASAHLQLCCFPVCLAPQLCPSGFSADSRYVPFLLSIGLEGVVPFLFHTLHCALHVEALGFITIHSQSRLGSQHWTCISTVNSLVAARFPSIAVCWPRSRRFFNRVAQFAFHSVYS
ncbi:hypothetical protein R1flu_027670 [Riccia fluitans]|uniref:Uncharacterized protein n=1 Tax=Riccia fluitans TaxID=41844 RepID=A0ABD1XJG2_9MARC